MKQVGKILSMIAVALFMVGAWQAQSQENILYNFGASKTDGENGNSALVADTHGNLYGTTEDGGTYGGGTAFELSPAAGGTWTETVIFNFGGPITTGLPGQTDGYGPNGLIIDKNGNLYGTTQVSGLGFTGTAFELIPAQSGLWTEVVLHNFSYSQSNLNEGQNPGGTLVFDVDGNLYGTTNSGGPNNAGTVFELSPAGVDTWNETIIYSFGTPATDGYGPGAGLVLDGNGNLYGTTSFGGMANGGGSSGDGTVFELSPAAGNTWTEKVLYNFGATSTDGYYPSSSLILDGEGNLYGTTRGGGAVAVRPGGTVFEVSPAAGGKWTEAVLYSFPASASDGTGASGGVIFDLNGNLFGTTTGGGQYSQIGFSEPGTVYELSPSGTGTWTESVLHSFGHQHDGSVPGGGLLMDSQGNLYGTTGSGGTGSDYSGNQVFADSAGVAYEIAATAVPTFSPAGGSYNSTQSVTLNDTTANATIYYTTNGTQPTTSSTKYTAAISVSATETIEAIAVAAGYTNSAVVSGTYTIQAPTAAAPIFSPAMGTYTSAQNVTITDSTSGAVIYYTTNGTAPTASSTVYNGVISVSTTETIEAIAIAPGFANSIVSTATYTINLTASTPVIAPAGGTYTSTQSVTITDSTAGATIYYTTNGTTPTASSTAYNGAISVSATETVEAIAIANGFTNSAVASAAYTINLAAALTPVIAPAAGTYSSTQSVTITDATAGATIYYTTNGAAPTASSTVYGGAISVSSSETIEAIAVANGFSNSAVASAAYTITLPAATPVISPTAGTYTSMQNVTITDATTGATVYYTTNGTIPTVSSSVYGGAISVGSTETIEAIAVAGGFANSPVATAAYTINLAAAATPVISPAAGTYSSTQSVTITDSTAGAAIYYTTNGSTPTSASTLYAGAISVSSTETVEAIAVAGGFSNSAVGSAAYVIQVVTPSYTLAASPSTLTIKSGSTGSTVITLTPTGGFTGTVNFTCGTLPTDVTCGFAPGSLTVPSTGALTTTLTIGTSGTTMASLHNGPSVTLLPEIFVAMILLPLGFTRRMLRVRKGGNPWLMGLLLLATAGVAAAGVAGISGCGGSSKKTTLAGTYTVPVEVTSGGTTVPLNLSITVQ